LNLGPDLNHNDPPRLALRVVPAQRLFHSTRRVERPPVKDAIAATACPMGCQQFLRRKHILPSRALARIRLDGEKNGDLRMKLYMHPVSTAARPVQLLIAENGIKCDEEMVDILKGAHYQEPYASLNPNRLVPMLEDGDFRLTESSAILKYLAEKYDLPSYPKDLKKRAKVNEVMDWLNTQFYRDFGYGLIYPQLFPHHKRRSDEAHAGAIAWGQQSAKNWLQIFNDHWIGPNKQYLCGSELTIGDYFGAGIVSIGELIGCDFSVYPNIKRWLENMKKLKSWNQVNEVFNGFVAANKDKEFVRV
jgi:glutathione S-transferase